MRQEQKTWTPSEVVGYVQWYETGIEYIQSGLFFTAKEWFDATKEIQWPKNILPTLDQYRMVEEHLILSQVFPDPFEDFVESL